MFPEICRLSFFGCSFFICNYYHSCLSFNLIEPEINIPYFRKVHSDVTNILTMLCDKWDVKVAGLETDLTDGGEGIDDEGIALAVVFAVFLLLSF